MSFWTTLGQVGGGAADTYFRNNLGDKWDRARREKAASDEAAGLNQHAPGAKRHVASDAENAKTAVDGNSITNGADQTTAPDAAPMQSVAAYDYKYGVPDTAPISEAERYAKMEDIYRRHGFNNRADLYGQRAYTAKRDDKQDARQAVQDASAERINALNAANLEMRNTDAAYQQTQRAALDNANRAISEGIANGTQFSPAQKTKIFRDYGVNQQNALASRLASLNFGKTEFDSERERLYQKASIAAAKGGLNGMIDLFNTDPDYNDNTSVSTARTKNGMVVLTHKTNDGKVLYTSQPMTEKVAIGEVISTLKDPMAAIEWQEKMAGLKSKRDLEAAQAYHAGQIGRLAGVKAAGIAAAPAGTEAANAKPGSYSKSVNDGVKQIALMHGAKTDSFGAFSFTDIEDKSAYSRDIAKMEEMVMSGIPPMKAADMIMQGTRREQNIRTVTKNDKPANGAATALRDKLRY